MDPHSSVVLGQWLTAILAFVAVVQALLTLWMKHYYDMDRLKLLSRIDVIQKELDELRGKP